jgi:hypothetical protein
MWTELKQIRIRSSNFYDHFERISFLVATTQQELISIMHTVLKSWAINRIKVESKSNGFGNLS